MALAAILLRYTWVRVRVKGREPSLPPRRKGWEEMWARGKAASCTWPFIMLAGLCKQMPTNRAVENNGN